MKKNTILRCNYNYFGGKYSRDAIKKLQPNKTSSPSLRAVTIKSYKLQSS